MKPCCSSFTKLCQSLWPHGLQHARLPVLHYLPELAQTHVHWVVTPSNHLILRRPLLLLPSIFPSIRVFSNESALCIRWLKCWSSSFSISPSTKYSGWLSFRGWITFRFVDGSHFYFFPLRLMRTWVVSTSGQLWTMLLWTFVCMFLQRICFPSSWMCT